MALPTITNNSPSVGRIAWSAFGIQYDGVGYSVPAGNSASKFIWWQFNNGSPTVQAADVLPDLAPEDYLLFLNKNGIGTLVDTTQVIDGSLVVSGSILADGIGANQIQTHHLVANAVTTDKLAANAVTANEIAAGAVTASKLSIGAVGDNMVLNGSFEDGTQGFTLVSSGAGAVADVVTGVSSSGANALRLVRGTASNLIVGQESDYFIPVTSVAGRSWYVACRAGAGSSLASGFYLRVYWFQANKTSAASTASVDIASNQPLSTSWTVFEGAVTPPANARYMRVAVINALSGSTMYVDEITAHEVVVSAQIGDGQVTTPKLVANAVTAEKIAANAVTATKIAANAVTATQIAATAIDGKTITGATVRTAASGQRVQLDLNGLRTFNSAGTETARLAAGTGGLELTGGLRSSSSSGSGGRSAELSSGELRFFVNQDGSKSVWMQGLDLGSAYAPMLEIWSQPPHGAARRSVRFGNDNAGEVVTSLFERVHPIKGFIFDTYGWQTFQGSTAGGLTIGVRRYMIRAGWVHVQMQWSGNVPVGSTDVWTGISSLLRPSENVQGAAWMGGYPVTAFMRPNGTIAVQNQSGAPRSGLHVTFTYPDEQGW